MFAVVALFVAIFGVSSAEPCCTPRAWEGEFHSGFAYLITGQMEPKFAKVSDNFITLKTNCRVDCDWV